MHHVLAIKILILTTPTRVLSCQVSSLSELVFTEFTTKERSALLRGRKIGKLEDTPRVDVEILVKF